MQLSAVLLARVIGFVETNDLDPRGHIFYPDMVSELVQRYGFQTFPRTPEQFDEQKGIEFHDGKAESKIIQKFAIYNTGLMLETRSSTDDSKQILEDMLEWGKDKFKLSYESRMIQRWAYVSNVTFHSDHPLLTAGSSPLASLAKKASRAVSDIFREDIDYEPIVLTLGYDMLKRKYPIAGFTIQRRGEAPFSENKYFSEAPLPTELHLTLLQEFEADIISAARAPKLA